MRTLTLPFELITPGFCGGAAPHEQAEIRVPAIRGQLRWWFRTLGGFSTLARLCPSVREQESVIFGSAAGTGTASYLRIQVQLITPLNQTIVGPQEVAAQPGKKYLLWPFAQDHGANARAALNAGTRFGLRVHWLGDPNLWPSIQALISVFGHVGSLGTRSRRAMGALAFSSAAPLALPAALACFCNPAAISVRQLGVHGFSDCNLAVAELARWLQGWRQHGQQSRFWIWHDKHDHNKGGYWKPISDPTAVSSPGFPFARRDHNEGLKIITRSYPSDPKSPPANSQGMTYRAALGLPIVQLFSSLGDANGPYPKNNRTVNWEYGTMAQKGRFASPVILRPYRVTPTDWRALVIFVDAHQWDPSQRVHLNGTALPVSLDLYNEMKRQTPTPFP